MESGVKRQQILGFFEKLRILYEKSCRFSRQLFCMVVFSRMNLRWMAGQAAIACRRRCVSMSGGLNDGLRCWL
jgi:hypothetical protein